MSEYFEVEYKDLGGRVGVLRTRHGEVETPALAPVINPVKVTVEPQKMYEIGYRFFITNAYLIWKNYGDVARDLKVHGILSLPQDAVVMTDSGAYQILEYGYLSIDPDHILRYQAEIGSDIAVILDIPTKHEASREVTVLEVEETLRRARRAVAMREELGEDILLVGPVQGGTRLDILRYSAQVMSRLPFDIYAVGSPTTLLENYEFEPLVDMIATVRFTVPLSRPLHLFGAGHPMMLALAVALGCDLFDSASYALYARGDRYLTPQGTYRLEDLSTLPCTCPVCTRYSVEELRELPKYEREKLLALHNLYVIASELREIREAIREGRLWELLEVRCRSHPGLYRALKRLRKYVKYLEKLDPLTHGEVRGLLFLEGTTWYRPEVVRYRRRILENYVPPQKPVLLLILGDVRRPYERDPRVRNLVQHLLRRGLWDQVHIVVLSRVFGPVPLELSDLYPLSQHEEAVGWCEVRSAVRTLVEYVKRNLSTYRYLIIYDLSEEELSRVLQRLCTEVLGPGKVWVLRDASVREVCEYVTQLLRSQM